jgi:hypothetical protein
MRVDDQITELPISWTVVKLGDFVENEKGKKPQSESKVETSTHNLVPQDPNDEPASVLLERIRAEKAALIAPTKKGNNYA